MNMDMMQTGFQAQNQDGSAPRPNFWPQFLMGLGGMVTPGQGPPPAAVFPPAVNPPITRFPSGGASRPSLPGPLLIPVPSQPLHHAQSAGPPLVKQMLPVVGKPERALSEGLSTKVRKPYTITKQRERWTEAEHERFLEALKLHGRAWRKIEEHIGSKTAVQIRSHAQKFFSKLEREGSTANPTSSAPEIDIPPPRPKRKPSHPYPRKAGGNMSESESEYGPSPRTGFRNEGFTSPQDEVMSPNNEPLMSNRSGGFSLWRNGSLPDPQQQGSPAHPPVKDSAALTLGRSASINRFLADKGEQQNSSLKLFGQLLGPASKNGQETAVTEDREQQKVAGKPRFEEVSERNATPERSFLESGVSSAVIEGDATDSYAPTTSGRGAPISRAYSKEGARQQSSGYSKDFAFAAPPPKTARTNQQNPPTFMKPELAFSQAPGPPPFAAAMSGGMPAQLAQMLASQFGGAPQFGGGQQQWMPFGAGGPWNPAAFEQLAMLAQMNAYNSSNSNPFGPWGPNPAAMWAGFGAPQNGNNGKGGDKNQTAEEAAAESRAAAAAVAAATMAAASAWWTLQNNAAAAAQMGRPPNMPFSNPPFQQQSPAGTPLGQNQNAEFTNPPLMRMPTQRSMPRAAQSEEIPRPNSPGGSLKESELEQRNGPSAHPRAAHPSVSAPELETEGGNSSMGAPGGGTNSGAAIRRAERANKLRELKGRAAKNGNELLADSSATPGVYADSCPWAASQHRRSLESSADKAAIPVPKAGGAEEKGGIQKEEQTALEVAILKKLKKDERRRDKLRTQSASGSNEPAGGGALAAGQSNDRTAEAAPQRGGSPPELSNSDGGASGSGKEGSGGPSSNSSAGGGDKFSESQGGRTREGSEGASSEADRIEASPNRDADKGGAKESQEKGAQDPPLEGGPLVKQKSLPSGDQGSGNSNLPGGAQAKDSAKGGAALLVRVGSVSKHHHHRHHHHAHTPASAATLGSSTAGGSSGFVPYKGYQGTFVSITREGSIDSQGRIKHERGEGDLPSPAKRQRVQVVAGEGMISEKGGAEERRSKSPPQKKSPPLAGGGGSGGLSMLMQF